MNTDLNSLKFRPNRKHKPKLLFNNTIGYNKRLHGEYLENIFTGCALTL